MKIPMDKWKLDPESTASLRDDGLILIIHPDAEKRQVIYYQQYDSELLFPKSTFQIPELNW